MEMEIASSSPQSHFTVQVFTKHTNLGELFIDVKGDDRVSDVIDKITPMLMENGLPTGWIWGLVHMGRPLQLDWTLSHYNIGPNASLYLTKDYDPHVSMPTGVYHIFVKTFMTGKPKTITLDVESSDSIKTVKEKILEQEVYLDHTRLVYDCKSLEDDKTLADYKINIDSLLYLVVRFG